MARTGSDNESSSEESLLAKVRTSKELDVDVTFFLVVLTIVLGLVYVLDKIGV